MAQQQQQQGMDLGKAGVLSLNNLTYSMSPDLSVAVSRTVTSQFFQNQTHAPGSTGICILNTGSAYVNARESFLVLDIQNTSTITGSTTTGANAWFGIHGGSAANFINRLTILSRSGQVLEKIDRANQLAAIKCMYRHDKGWRESVGSAMGITEAATSVVGSEGLDWAGGSSATGQVIRFIIPLSHISPMFDSVETLLPSQLCSGLRFELVFETAQTAMMGVNATDNMSYEIKQCRIQTESYLLSDLVLRSLNETSASSGLEIVIKTAHNSFGNRTGTKSLNADMGKACSRALSFILKERPYVAATAASTDHFKAFSYDATNYVDEWQARVGSLYFPMSSIRAGDGKHRGSTPELFATALRSFGKLYQSAGVSAGLTEAQYRNGCAVFAQELERSNVQELSGIPLSQSRTLSVNCTWAGSSNNPSDTQIDFYLVFVSLIRVFSSNVVVEI